MDRTKQIQEILKLLEYQKQALESVHAQTKAFGTPSETEAAMNIRDSIEEKVRDLL